MSGRRLKTCGLRLEIAHRSGLGLRASPCALQERWLRVSRANIGRVANLESWLTTVVAHVCLDALKWRESRREELTPDDPRHDVTAMAPHERPEEQAILADSIGVALLILLDALPPAERIAFVLHDMSDLPFDDIAGIVGKTAEAARQLASRARRRVRGACANRDAAMRRHDELVHAFLAASRTGNFSALVALLDPGPKLRADAAVAAMGGAAYWQEDRLATGIDGADAVAVAGHSRNVRVPLNRFLLTANRAPCGCMMASRASRSALRSSTTGSQRSTLSATALR